MNKELNFNKIPIEIKGYELKIDKNYLSSSYKKEGFKLCIIGKDPYPTNPNGIPFCKIEINNKTCSGYYLLKALGFIFENKKYKIEEISKIFFDFLNEEVLFLNASYYFLNGTLSKLKHIDLIQKSHEINKPLIDKSKNVVFLGASSKIINWLPLQMNNNMFYPIIHPDFRNKNKKPTEWNSFYSEPYGVNEFIVKLKNNRK